MPGRRGGGLNHHVRKRKKRGRITEDYLLTKPGSHKQLNPNPFMFMSKTELKERREGTYVGHDGIRQPRRRKRRRSIRQRLGGLD